MIQTCGENWEEGYKGSQLLYRVSGGKGQSLGDLEFYYNDGKIQSKGKCENRIQIGYWEIYSEKGALTHQTFYGRNYE